MLQICKLVSPHGTSTEIADFSCLDEIMKGFHCFFGRRGGVIAMNLEDINVIGVQAREGGFNLIED